MSENALENDSDKHHEKWDDFGSNLKSYIKSNKEELIKDSYDVILGFSRGGSILAYTFACMLKDNLDEYSDPHKASVRPIPKGFACKRDNPCFIMDHPASHHEKKDIITELEKDLKEFARTHKINRPLNVLVMDDNLTGATRVTFLEDELHKMKGCVGLIKTLAYVRHPAFLPMKTITKFPEGKDFFIMPWHKPHPKKDLDLPNEEIDLVKIRFYIKVNETFNLTDFIVNLNNYYGSRGNSLINGASIFFLRENKIKNDSFVELNFFPNKFYPPKQCLNNSKVFGSEPSFLSLCSLCTLDTCRTMGVCLVCSILNCNKQLLEKALIATNSQTISIELEFNGTNNTNMNLAIKKWLSKSLSGIKFLDF